MHCLEDENDTRVPFEFYNEYFDDESPEASQTHNDASDIAEDAMDLMGCIHCAFVYALQFLGSLETKVQGPR